MKFRYFALVGLALVGCGASTSTGASREVDDHPGASRDGSGGSGGAVAAGGATGGGGADAGAPETDAELCGGGGSVTNVRMSRAPTKPAPAGAGGAPARVDGGRPGLPTDSCVTYTPPDCPGAPRWIFGCPIVDGPDRNPVIHPGDAVKVMLPMSDDGLAAYSCAGVDTDSALTGGAALFSAVRPAYVQETGHIPPSTPPGTVMHFTAVASGSAYSASNGTACSNDLTQVDFDVIVE